MKTIKGYKFIKKNMKSKEGNHKWKLGKWYKEEEIELCKKGFHASEKPLDSLEYIYGDKWFIVEAKGKVIKDKDKFVAQEMRLVKELDINKILKPFAIFCAKQCLKYYEKEYPNDKRIAECIQAAELYLVKKISLTELEAKISAAWSAARSAESAAESAWSAAQSAAGSAGSAWSAAGSAARSAGSAWSAAWSAARSAWSAAWSAQNKQLNKFIKKYLEDEL